MDVDTKRRGYAIVGLLGAAAGALAVLIIARRLPDLMTRMMTRMMSQMMKGTESGTIPDMRGKIMESLGEASKEDSLHSGGYED